MVGVGLSIGVLGGAVALPTAEAAHHRRRHHSKRHHKVTTKNCIPQGNVGDNDADNHGGPSDGDGCL